MREATMRITTLQSKGKALALSLPLTGTCNVMHYFYTGGVIFKDITCAYLRNLINYFRPQNLSATNIANTKLMKDRFDDFFRSLS